MRFAVALFFIVILVYSKIYRIDSTTFLFFKFLRQKNKMDEVCLKSVKIKNY